MNLFKKCCSCNRDQPLNSFTKVRSKFFNDGMLTICDDCLDLMIKQTKPENQWEKVNKMCQWADVPFVPEEWEKIRQGGNSQLFNRYCRIFKAKEFDTVPWSEYNEVYIKLHQTGDLVDEVPGYTENKYKNLVKKWGSGYDTEQLDRLEELFNETMATQNINTGNQIDQVKKICKTSLLIDERIEENQPYKDLMDSYEKLIKVADLAPKNTKNSNDFDSTGEVFGYLEKKGWVNRWYDGAVRDEVDETIKNTQNWIRKLCLSESTLTEEILQKLNNLSSMEEDGFDSFDYDSYEKEGVDTLNDENIDIEV